MLALLFEDPLSHKTTSARGVSRRARVEEFEVVPLGRLERIDWSGLNNSAFTVIR